MTLRAPNILVILTDNQGCDAVGCYADGDDFETPNIDRLADEGTRYTHFFGSNGMCSGGRATLLTGLMPSQHGTHSWLQDEQLKSWPEAWCCTQEFRTLPQTLKDRGYRSAHIGKWHLGQPYPAPAGYFDDWLTLAIGHTLNFYDNVVIDGDGAKQHVVGQHIVDFFTDATVTWLQEYEGDKPFYLEVWYDGPYALPPTNLGPDPRNPYYEHFATKEFKSVPRVPVNHQVLDQLQEMAERPRDQWSWGDGWLWEQLWWYTRMQNDLTSLANYAAQCAVVDAGIGRIMGALDDAGLARDTLVVVSSDQANLFGQHGLWGHTITTFPSHLYDEAMNLPLICRQPGTVPAGRVSDRLIGQYDLAPTCSDWAGVRDAEFSGSPGLSFAGDLRGEAVSTWPRHVFFEQEETRGVRTHEYSYWKRLAGTGGNVLFDMRKDPAQQNNVVDDPGYAAVVEELDRQVVAWFSRYAAEEYDVWRGGTAKGSVQRPHVYRELYGDEWRLQADMADPFVDEELAR